MSLIEKLEQLSGMFIKMGEGGGDLYTFRKAEKDSLKPLVPADCCPCSPSTQSDLFKGRHSMPSLSHVGRAYSGQQTHLQVLSHTVP